MSAGIIPKDGPGYEIPDNYSYNESTATSTLNTSTSSVGASTGVAVTKPGTFRSSSLYQYRVEPFIFGTAPPQGTVQEIDTQTDNQTTGALHTAYAADPADSLAGSWWTSDASPYTQYIDVALNHPSRWALSRPTNSVSEENLNCLNVSGPLYNCLAINQPVAGDIWNSSFYWMRGLFTTVEGTSDPQRNYADVGDDVFLQARVYNYSLKDMDPESEIRVRFYRQELDGTTPTGDSVLIEDVKASPLPGFNSDASPDSPNWLTVTTSFEATDDMAEKYHFFWVEDASGNMIGELPGHGLSELPETLTAIDDVSLEEVTIEGNDGNPQTVSFSNNVGFLHQKFYIASESTSNSEPAGTLSIENARVTVGQPGEQNSLPEPVDGPGEQVIVSADVVANGGSANGIVVHFGKGHPLRGNHAFDIESIPFIREGDSNHLSVPYKASTCGTHEIVIVANPRRDSETLAKTSFVVPCLSYFPVLPISAGKPY